MMTSRFSSFVAVALLLLMLQKEEAEARDLFGPSAESGVDPFGPSLTMEYCVTLNPGGGYKYEFELLAMDRFDAYGHAFVSDIIIGDHGDNAPAGARKLNNWSNTSQAPEPFHFFGEILVGNNRGITLGPSTVEWYPQGAMEKLKITGTATNYVRESNLYYSVLGGNFTTPFNYRSASENLFCAFDLMEAMTPSVSVAPSSSPSYVPSISTSPSNAPSRIPSVAPMQHDVEDSLSLSLHYCVTPSYGVFKYDFRLFAARKGGANVPVFVSDIVFGVHGDIEHPGARSLQNWFNITDAPKPFLSFDDGTGTDYGGVTLGPVNAQWYPQAIEDSLTWSGTAATDITEDSLTWSGTAATDITGSLYFSVLGGNYTTSYLEYELATSACAASTEEPIKRDSEPTKQVDDAPSEIQDLTFNQSTHMLGMTNSAVAVDLSHLINDDANELQELSFNNETNQLTLTDSDETVDLSHLVNPPQELTFDEETMKLGLTGSSAGVDLSSLVQDLSLNGNQLEISSSGSAGVDLSFLRVISLQASVEDIKGKDTSDRRQLRPGSTRNLGGDKGPKVFYGGEATGGWKIFAAGRIVGMSIAANEALERGTLEIRVADCSNPGSSMAILGEPEDYLSLEANNGRGKYFKFSSPVHIAANAILCFHATRNDDIDTDKDNAASLTLMLEQW